MNGDEALSRKNGRFLLLPNLGILAFLALYFYASSLYPGGTKFDHATQGYSQLGNFWCDLLDSVTYSGAKNPGRPFALAATVVLPLTFTVFWFLIPGFLGWKRWQGWLIRLAGCASMLLAMFIFTPAHDFVINAASLLGFAAFLMTQIGLAQKREFLLIATSGVAISLCLANFLMWRTGFRLEQMPIVQKLAFASFFAWVALTTQRIHDAQ